MLVSIRVEVGYMQLQEQDDVGQGMQVQFEGILKDFRVKCQVPGSGKGMCRNWGVVELIHRSADMVDVERAQLPLVVIVG